MIIKKFVLILVFFVLIVWMIQVQILFWLLEKCIEYVCQNNFSLWQVQYDICIVELDVQESKYSWLLVLNVGVRVGYQFGCIIDFIINSFNNECIGFNSFFLDVNVMFYGGGFINNFIK